MSPRMVTQRVSVKASRLAVPPKRAPVPGVHDAAERYVGLVVDGLLVHVDDPGRDAPGQVKASHHVVDGLLHQQVRAW